MMLLGFDLYAADRGPKEPDSKDSLTHPGASSEVSSLHPTSMNRKCAGGPQLG